MEHHQFPDTTTTAASHRSISSDWKFMDLMVVGGVFGNTVGVLSGIAFICIQPKLYILSYMLFVMFSINVCGQIMKKLL